MSSSTAELTLVLKAQNLAKGAIADVRTAIGGIAAQAQTAGAALTTAFAGKGALLARELGGLVTNVLSGSSWETAAINLGATLAGGLAAAFGEKVIERLGATAAVQGLMAAVTGAWTAAGTAIGGFVAAAIPVGMALLPFLLVAALVAAIAFLVTHPEIAGKILEVASSIVSGIVNGLASLAGALLHVFTAAFGALVDLTITIVGGIVGFYLGIPGRLADFGRAILGVFSEAFGAVARFVGGVVSGIIGVIGGIITKVQDALAWLTRLGSANEAAFGTGGSYQGRGGGYGQHAEGGWAGLHGPELSWLGEKGPEYVIPNHELGGRGGSGSRSGFTIQGVSEEDIVDMVDRGLYFRLQRSAPTDGR